MPWKLTTSKAQGRVQGLGTRWIGGWPASRPKGAILAYHRINRAAYDPWRLSVTPEHFEQHLAELSRRKVVPLTSLPRTPGGIAITFDDGYADNLETALPLLKKYRLPATVFVATDAVRGREFWWDRVEHALLASRQVSRRWLGDAPLLRRGRTIALGVRLRALGPHELDKYLSELPHVRPASEPACERHRLMGEDGLRELAASPLIEIGAHTRSHPRLPRLTEQEQLDEVGGSRDLLERLTSRRVRAFAYPFGAHDETSVRVVARAGFELACIVGGGLVRSNTDLYRLPRLMVRDLPGAVFAQHLRFWTALRGLA
jgi:peptidoglycan/xylan/chitin deacetylase (PgdA/CDA1 family)